MPVAIHDADYDKAAKVLSNVAHIQYLVASAIAEERERCAQAAEWFHNVGKFTAADVAKRIRSAL